jgi:hypothetical protein
MFSAFVINYYIWPICHNLFICVPLEIITMSRLYAHILAYVWLRVCTIFLSFWYLVLCVLNNLNVHQLHRVSLSTHSPTWNILRFISSSSSSSSHDQSIPNIAFNVSFMNSELQRDTGQTKKITSPFCILRINCEIWGSPDVRMKPTF